MSLSFRFVPLFLAAIFYLPFVSSALAAPPVITSAPELDVFYRPEDPGSLFYSYLVTATEAPTSFDATGLPANASINRSTGAIVGSPETSGSFLVTLGAANADGTGSATLRLRIHPAATSVLATRGSYTTGQNFTVTVGFNAPLVVSGVPAVALVIGSTMRQAAYASGSGTNTIVFRYIVIPGDNDPDGVEILALNFSAGRLHDANGLEPGTAVPLRFFQSGVTVSSPPRGPGSATNRLINLSSRVKIRDGDVSRSLIAGFVVTGTPAKPVLVRAVGPSLENFGVSGTVANPRLRITDQSGRVVAENDDWGGSDTGAAFVRLGAFALTGGSRDAAMLVELPPGAYSLEVVANGGDGVALAEIYDANDSPAADTQQVINLSTRAFVDTGEGVLATGFVVSGAGRQRVLIRGVGPALARFDVPGVLGNPWLRLYQKDKVVAQNDDWETPQPLSGGQNAATAAELASAATSVGAFALSAGSADAALIVALSSGTYTAVLSGANNTTGAGMVEIYQLPADDQ